MACIVPFTSSMTYNLIRSLETLFELKLSKQRFYAFMASSTLPWEKLWMQVWKLIPNSSTTGRIILTLDDSINPKTGKKIFGCSHFHNHASKGNQSPYPWSQYIVVSFTFFRLLKKVKSRWACLPLSFRFYMMEKTIKQNFRQIASYSPQIMRNFTQNQTFPRYEYFLGQALNNNLFDFPKTATKSKGRPKSYSSKLGNVKECGELYKDKAVPISVLLYGKQREIMVYSRNLMSKNLQREIKVVWVFRKTRFVTFFTTDLTLSVQQIVEYYRARWKIESGFKKLKQEIGSAKTQTRNSFAVENHLNLCIDGKCIYLNLCQSIS